MSLRGAISGLRQSLRGSSDVICGIRATPRGVRPQTKRAPSTVDRDCAVNDWNKPESSTALLPQVLISSATAAGLARSLALPSWPTCTFFTRIALAGGAALGHSSAQAAQPGGRCSQGGVKVPTGGKGDLSPSPRAPSSTSKKGQQIRCD